MGFIDNEKRKRRCTKCKEIKNKAEFYRLNKKRNLYATRCKKCEKLVRKEKYEKSKEKVYLKEVNTIAENRLKIKRFLEESSCSTCQEENSQSLYMFDCFGEKFTPNLRYKLNLSDLGVRCANCIKIKKNRVSRPQKTKIREYLSTKKCLKCGNSNLETLMLYSDQKHNLKSDKSFLEEICKYDILCANCYSKVMVKNPQNPSFQQFLKIVF